MNKNIKACLFDLDGVIVDTARFHFIAWWELAHELGIIFTEEQNERLKGVSRMRSLEILLEIGGISLDESEKLRLADLKNKRYVDLISQMNPGDILPGVQDFISELKKHDFKTAIGSASKNAGFILNRLKIEDLFDAIIDGNKVSKAKPDPEVFLKGAYELNVSPSECVVFEDAEAGVEAAINGGMYCVGIGKKEILGKAHLVIPGFLAFKVQDLNFLSQVQSTI